VWNVAEVLLEVAERRLTGIYHAVCPDVTTRYQLARRIAELFDLDQRYIDATTMDKVGAIARRPKMLMIDTHATARSLNTRLLTFDEGVRGIAERCISRVR
jgi:dTDP-4-dehydrorhamnose reductase